MPPNQSVGRPSAAAGAPGDASAGAGARRRGLAPWTIVAASAPVHLALALATQLSPDEAYYLCAARRGWLVAPFTDHPPLLPWLIRLSDGLAGLPVELRVRVWPMAFSVATALAVVELARRRGASREGCRMAAWAGAWGLLPMAGGFVATPDGPALLAMVAALLLLGPRARTPLACGVALAVGALAKVAVLPVVLAVAVGAGVEARRDPGGSQGGAGPTSARGGPRPAFPGPPPRLRVAVRAGAFAAIVLPPALTLPLLWPSLRFQLQHAFGQGAGEGWSALGALGALGAVALAQLALWSPWVMVRGARALGRVAVTDRAVAVVVSSLVVLSAVVRAVPPEPNWWAPAALVIVAAMACSVDRLSRSTRTLVLASLLGPTAVAVLHTAHPFLPIAPDRDPTARLQGWNVQSSEPLSAPGVGVYGPAAERCVYRGECGEIEKYFSTLTAHP